LIIFWTSPWMRAGVGSFKLLEAAST
jgi:hypothetical protein